MAVPDANVTQCIGAVIVIIGTILQVTANTVGHLIAGRIVTGAGVGINTAIIPTVSSPRKVSLSAVKIV